MIKNESEVLCMLQVLSSGRIASITPLVIKQLLAHYLVFDKALGADLLRILFGLESFQREEALGTLLESSPALDL